MSAVFCLAAAFIVWAVGGIYYLGDRPARRPALIISAISLGVAFALQAVLTYRDGASRWTVWLYAIAAVAMPIVVIWSSRREERRKDPPGS